MVQHSATVDPFWHLNETKVSTTIVEHVNSLYETHPYPRYPLLARPRYGAGYTSSTIWSYFQYPQSREHQPYPLKILIAGCGEILPWVVEKWAPRSSVLCALDLSQRSLQRAYLRQWFTRPTTTLARQFLRWQRNKKLSSWISSASEFVNLDAYEGLGNTFCHSELLRFLNQCQDNTWNYIDGFGVLHHMASPKTALREIYRVLAPGGICRLMIYNTPARRWIWNIQRLFHLLNLSYVKDEDFRLARSILKKASLTNQKLHQRLAAMGKVTLEHKARFADTFFHPREARTSPVVWREWLDSLGFQILGQFDRYGELDHLPNPLWQPPSAQILQGAIDQGLFSGNLEFYVTKPHLHRPSHTRTQYPTLTRTQFFQLLLDGPPAHWFQFPETSCIPRYKQYIIWLSFLQKLLPTKDRFFFKTDLNLSVPALQRLARLGFFSKHDKDSTNMNNHVLLKPITPPPKQEDSQFHADAQDIEILYTWICSHVQNPRHPKTSPSFSFVVKKRLQYLLEI